MWSYNTINTDLCRILTVDSNVSGIERFVEILREKQIQSLNICRLLLVRRFC